MGPKAGLDSCETSPSHQDSIPEPSSPYPVAIPTELPGLRKAVRMVFKYAPEIQEQTLTALLAIPKVTSSSASNSGRNSGLVL
jgi:hypothetical protein